MNQVGSSPVVADLANGPAVFRRSPAAQVAGSLGAAIGAVLFGGFAIAMFAGLLVSDLAARVLYGGIVTFFAILMAASAVAAFRRGRDTRVAEVGQAGVWTPELGFAAWTELAQVRLELVGGPAGPRNSSIRQYRRLGLVPLDDTRRPTSAAALAQLMTQGYLALVRRLAPSADLGDARLAPFGISETDLPKDFDDLVELTRTYVQVIDAPRPPA
jgi:hypothetical protein